MSVFCTKWFKRWSKKSNLKDQDLIEAVANMKAGLSSSDLGNHLFKIRVKKPNSGKSSGFRTIVVYRENDRAIFLYGFGKNERDNISTSELQHFKKLGNDLLALDKDKLKHFVDEKILFDIKVSR